jgi:hypothetical protein
MCTIIIINYYYYIIAIKMYCWQEAMMYIAIEIHLFFSLFSSLSAVCVCVDSSVRVCVWTVRR